MSEFQNLTDFFKYNLEVKKIMVDMAPEKDFSIVKYGDKLYKSLKDIEFYINKMMSLYPIFESQRDYVKKLFSSFYLSLIKCSSKKEKLKNFYISCISDLNEDIVNLVGENCVGYSLHRSVSLSNCHTINELLHVMHQTVINNEEILDNLPKIDEKINDFNYPVYYCGKETNLGKRVFDNFPSDLDVGLTHIVSLSEDKVLFMIRDRGHALTINVAYENGIYYVNYFIPKICNVDMVNNLKGVRKVNSNSKFTTGVFETNNDNFLADIFNFISKVPMDSDMIFDDKFYQTNNFGGR